MVFKGDMKRRFLRTTVVAMFLALLVVRAPLADGFFRDMEDLPLMAGLTERADDSMIFDSGSGRIVESFAEGRVRKQAVLDFYASTLPQLGWRQDAPGVFSREGETLMLAFPNSATISGSSSSADRLLTVRFTLSPAKE